MTYLELRGEIAKHCLHAYKVAAEADMHPATLSQLLNGRVPLTDPVAERIGRAIEKLGGRGLRRMTATRTGKAAVRAADDERDSLAARRLAYALEEVRQLRARLPAKLNQAAPPK